MNDLIAPILSAAAVLLGAYLAYRGTRDTDATDRLSKAAGLYSDYADKMEKRVTAVELKNTELQDSQEEVISRLTKTEKEAEQYKKEAKDYKKLILEVIQWITELLDWEMRGYKPPAPHFTLSMVLSHLTTSMKNREPSEESPDQKEVHNGD